jgi:vacuolar-type H+-ATPase subunit I/STV1
MNKLTEGTLIPIGLAVIAIGGGSMWLTSMYSAINEARATLIEVKEEQKEYVRHLSEIHRELSEIRGELKALRK